MEIAVSEQTIGNDSILEIEPEPNLAQAVRERWFTLDRVSGRIGKQDSYHGLFSSVVGEARDTVGHLHARADEAPFLIRSVAALGK
jgi:hypothetical protein